MLNKIKKKYFVVTMVLMLIVSMMPVMAFAQDNQPTNGNATAVTEQKLDKPSTPKGNVTVDIVKDEVKNQTDELSTDEINENKEIAKDEKDKLEAALKASPAKSSHTLVRRIDGEGAGVVSGINGYFYCCEPGYHFPPNGAPMQIRYLANDSVMARILYWWPCYRPEYWTMEKPYLAVSAALNIAANNGKFVKVGRLGTHVKETAEARSIYNEALKLPNPPEGFQAYIAQTSKYDSKYNQPYQKLYGYSIEHGKAKVKKVSANADENSFDKLCKNNYSLEGATYGMYKDEACTYKVHEFKTDKNGNTSEFECNVGTYYIKELKVSKGYRFDKDIHTAKVELNSSVTIESKEPTTSDPTNIKIEKVNTINPGSTKGLEGAEYTYRYYDVDPAVHTSSESLKAVNPTRSWTFKTMLEPDPDPARAAKGYKVAIARFDDKHKVSGDEFYMDKGNVSIPLGVFTVEETNAPHGFARDTNIYYGKVTQDPKTLEAVETLEGKTGTFDLNKGNGTQFENPQRIELVIQKTNAETLPEGVINHGTLEGAEYDIYALDASTKEGKIKVAHAVTGKDGKAVVTKADNGDILHPNTYYIKETKAPNGYTLDNKIPYRNILKTCHC